MPRGTRVVVDPGAVTELMHQCIDIVAERGQAIAAACNAESSWGGYESAAEVTYVGAMAVVRSIGEHDDEARTNRLVRNLGAGG
jgi:hypothetical protein